jgi:hypothetical protein
MNTLSCWKQKARGQTIYIPEWIDVGSRFEVAWMLFFNINMLDWSIRESSTNIARSTRGFLRGAHQPTPILKAMMSRFFPVA